MAGFLLLAGFEAMKGRFGTLLKRGKVLDAGAAGDLPSRLNLRY